MLGFSTAIYSVDACFLSNRYHHDAAYCPQQLCSKGKFVKKVTLPQSLPQLATGNHHLLFDCKFSEGADIKAKITIKLLDGIERVQAK